MTNVRTVTPAGGYGAWPGGAVKPTPAFPVGCAAADAPVVALPSRSVTLPPAEIAQLSLGQRWASNRASLIGRPRISLRSLAVGHHWLGGRSSVISTLVMTLDGS